MRSLHMSFGLKNVNVMNDDGGEKNENETKQENKNKTFMTSYLMEFN